jgi:hypothetical protein
VPPTMTIFWTCDIIYVELIICMIWRMEIRLIDIFERRMMKEGELNNSILFSSLVKGW